MSKQYLYGLSITVLAAILFSIKAIFIKIAYRYGASVDVVMALRVFFSLPIYLWMFYSIKRSSTAPYLSKKQLASIASLGICGYYFAAYLDLTGLKYISANLERLIIYLYPTLVVLLSAIFFKKAINKTVLACIGLSYTGVSIVFLQDFSLSSTDSTSDDANVLGLSLSPILWGAAITLFSAICFAVYITFSQSIIQRVGSKYFTVLAMSFASLAILIHSIVRLDLASLLHQPLMVYAMSACAAIIATVLPSFLLAEGIKQIGSNDASMASAIGPFGTLIAGGIFLGEAITEYHISGLILVVFGIFIMARHKQA